MRNQAPRLRDSLGLLSRQTDISYREWSTRLDRAHVRAHGSRLVFSAPLLDAFLNGFLNVVKVNCDGTTVLHLLNGVAAFGDFAAQLQLRPLGDEANLELSLAVFLNVEELAGNGVCQ